MECTFPRYSSPEGGCVASLCFHLFDEKNLSQELRMGFDEIKICESDKSRDQTFGDLESSVGYWSVKSS